MPRYSVQTNRLRFATCEAVQKLVNDARFPTEKEALQHIYNVARQKKQLTGFEIVNTTFQQTYQAYRNFKRRTEYQAYHAAEQHPSFDTY
jgi:hypothetical protein